jgi:hypothetical protein
VQQEGEGGEAEADEAQRLEGRVRQEGEDDGDGGGEEREQEQDGEEDGRPQEGLDGQEGPWAAPPRAGGHRNGRRSGGEATAACRRPPRDTPR